MTEQCGLYSTTTSSSIPLRGVQVHGRISGMCSEVTVTHRYHNTEQVDVEAVYVFPLEEGAAVSGFSARVGDRLIEGRVEEREKAFETYDDAMADGHGAFLLDQERPNIFTASVGNLKPDSEVEVTVTYVAMLRREGQSIRLMLPTTISPRYVAAGPAEVGEPDGERVNPPTQSKVPYGLTLSIEVLDGQGGLKSVESPSHPVRTVFEDDRAVVSLSADRAALDRDFVLLVTPKTPFAPTARVAREADGTRVAMIDFCPDKAAAGDCRSEVIFVIDCSGSMQGDSIEQARRALLLCVRGLAEGDTFNIYRFGSHFVSLWDKARPYGQESLDEATRWIQQTGADMGGTEILQPLRDIVARPADPERARQILLLTDGEVSNENDVIALSQAHASSSRIFSFGIGAGASEFLVRGVARGSGGAAEFIYPGERIEPKVLRMFGRVKTPRYDISIDWGGMEVEQAPIATPPLFAGDALTVFARIKHGAAEAVTLKAGEHTFRVELDLEHADVDSPVPTLWARQAIRDIEDGKNVRRGSNQRRETGEDRNRKRIVELGTRYGLMTSVTSYVAVEVRAEADKSTGQAELRKVPVALTTGWHGQGSVHGGLQGASAGGGGGKLAQRSRSKRKMAPMPPPGAPMPSPAMAPPAPRRAPAPAAAKAMREEAFAQAPGGVGGRASGAASGFVESARASLSNFFKGGGAEKEAKLDAGPSYPMEQDAFEGFADDVAAEAEPMAELSSSADLVFDLLMTQRADGSFPMSAVLESFVGPDSWARIQASAATQGDAIVATAVALAVLEKRASARRAEWGPAADKARRWLQSQSASVDGASLL